GFAQGTGPTVVPEPGAMALLGTGLLGLASLRRTLWIINRIRRERGPKLLLANPQCNTKN
ncbi:MAG TPA: PEP-CTERM sorting domain-containing protein, partial [Candidatus Sulfotelmatobacter sp.]|nr:PEP-CTERM sorting domain-containing protein [Candidatus Sulfotelmatobacter sp.]